MLRRQAACGSRFDCRSRRKRLANGTHRAHINLYLRRPRAKGAFQYVRIPTCGGILSDWLSSVADLAELAKGSTVSLSVTGLSRAGKTVFITSLVHNLLSALHQPHRMPATAG